MTIPHLTTIRHGTPAWFGRRASSITATDVPALFGAAKWKTPLSIFNRIVLGGRESSSTNAFMRWGQALEPVAAAEYERTTGLRVERNDFLAVHPELPWLVATPDGDAVDPLTGIQRLIEFKAPSHFTRDDWDHGEAPEFYVLQVQAQLLVTGLSEAVLCACVPPRRGDDDLVVSTIVRLSDERRAWMTERLIEWHHRHIIGEEPPDAIIDDFDLLRRMHPEDEDRTILLEGPDLRLARRHERNVALRERREAREGGTKARLMQRMGDAAWATDAEGRHVYQHKRGARGVRTFVRRKALPRGAPLPERAE